MRTLTWQNWAGTQQARPQTVRTPTSAAEVAVAVSQAAGRGERVRMVGSGHSFTAAAVTDGMLLAPTALGRVSSVDSDAGRVTVQAGLPLCDLNEVLEHHGLSLGNLGDIAAQTAAGATQTGTHGTGRTLAGLAQQILALELVLADGSIVSCSPEHNPDLFAAARLGLGAFGILTSVTFAVVPSFLLQAREQPMPLHQALEQLDVLRATNDHVEFYWFPYTDRVQTKQNNRVEGPAHPLPRWRRRLDDEFLQNTAFELVNRTAHRAPRLVPMINQVSARALTSRTYTDTAHRVLTTARRVRFVETEYAIPVETLGDVLREIRALLHRREYRITFPLEIRFAPADDVWLSPAYGRPTAYVAAHVHERGRHDHYFADLEAIFANVAGRPHWGKLHSRTYSDLVELYPRLGHARSVRDQVDPERRFGNAYIDRVLGD
ncbi:D-arabinono-1,4-lactone oxidase [Lipingzhangella sp. LS1_29]|uniref:D-arabinono-1,4-lactone oxidase n=1 Tax=Lipingzhangella rawalii TaxID=2055835 RepID=A0ABU2H1X0_9ACTN|nr:D-arabinono-1,4-lactone oxidase [Lipingzhangella rawalii]MDS1268820.1 D-arabinono-1,4-lactone oxidase [Lipingzhangella rawalii]